jgi:hypothetical protein
MITTPRKFNYWRTADIRVTRDGAGFYNARHKFQGYLYESEIFQDRNEARRGAVEALNDKKNLGK